MKKTLVSALTTALVVGAASTTFAAANPFSDVPSDHWAYDAVTELAANGVIEGYGDTTFQGNKNITRYEMAQMIARAMAKNTATGTDKALLDKLAAEFADELNKLGVRVANLEKYADKVTWHGEARYSYNSDRHDKKPNAAGHPKTKDNSDEWLLRLEPTAEVNANWKVKARLDAQNSLRKDDEDYQIRMKRLWAEAKYGNTLFQFGKIPDVCDFDKDMLFDDQLSGASVTFGKDVKVKLIGGRIGSSAGSGKPFRYDYKSKTTVGEDAKMNYQGIYITANKGKASGTVAYHHFNSSWFKNPFWIPYSKHDNKDDANIWEVAGTYRFSKNVALTGAYAQNTEADYYDKSGIVQLDYKGANKSNKGSWGAWLAYKHNGGNVGIDCNTDITPYNAKGVEVAFQYIPFKNIRATAAYYGGKDLTTDADSSHIFGRFDFFF